MKSVKIIALTLVILIIIFSIGCIEYDDSNNTNQDVTDDHLVTTGENISIACWNLQIFGPSKASNETLLDYYTDKLNGYDVFIVQEIRDASGTAIELFAEEFPDYQYIITNRAGQSSSKEQYAVFYNDQLNLVDSYDYQADYQEEMQRPPFKTTFTSNNWSFTLYTIHTQPDNVSNDLSVLEMIVGNPADDAIILGDLNADGSYYDEENIQHFTSWNWVISNDIDTTVASSDNTYDRIIINNATLNNFVSSGVMDDVNSDQSDHYLVYAVFNNSEN